MLVDDVLEMLEDNIGNAVSGLEIGRKLGVSRTAVWKAVGLLKSKGYPIVSYKNEGYLLDAAFDKISGHMLKKAISTDIIGREIYVYDKIDSTNTEAIVKATKGASDGTVIISDEQVSGRGRRGTGYNSPKGKGIYLSMILRPKISSDKSLLISAAAAVAICRSLENLLGLTPAIIWPSEIKINEGKLCGILCESSAEVETGDIKFIVVGIGVNVSMDNEGISLHEACGQDVSRTKVVCAILNEFDNIYAGGNIAGNAEFIINEYKKRCPVLNENIVIDDGVHQYTGVACDIDNAGKLLIKSPNGDQIAVSSGKVSVVNVP